MVNGPIEVTVCIIEFIKSRRDSQDLASFIIRKRRKALNELTTLPPSWSMSSINENKTTIASSMLKLSLI